MIPRRFSENPLLTIKDIPPSREDAEVIGVFNPAAWEHDRQIVLIIRVAERPLQEPGWLSTFVLDNHGDVQILRVKHNDPNLEFTDPRLFRYKGALFLTSISHLRRAISPDGLRFTVEKTPVVSPQAPEEGFGVEDPRVVKIDSTYYLTYCAVSPRGVCTCLATSPDMHAFRKEGIIFSPDNKDVVIFPEKVDGRYAAFHRPSASHFAAPSMWLAFSDDLLTWGDHRFLMAPRENSWDSVRIGCGPHPFRSSRGWVQYYHGADRMNRYCSGMVVLDHDKPWRIVQRDIDPFLAPETDYETTGFMPNVVFCTGLVERNKETQYLYYGAADDKICGCTLTG